MHRALCGFRLLLTKLVQLWAEWSTYLIYLCQAVEVLVYIHHRKCDQKWQNFATSVNFLILWQFFDGVLCLKKLSQPFLANYFYDTWQILVNLFE